MLYINQFTQPIMLVRVNGFSGIYINQSFPGRLNGFIEILFVISHTDLNLGQDTLYKVVVWIN